MLLSGRRSPPTDPRDVFVVSYPRSGSTWVRFLLANLLRADGEPVDFRTLPRVVPDLHITEHWEVIRNLAPPRLIKTHERPAKRFVRVIYVLRDGRDVAVSHYLYLRGLGRFDGSLREFIEDRRQGPTRWSEHVSAWLDAAAGLSLLTVRYEDLLTDPAAELRRMGDFAGLAYEPDDVARAVRRSSFEAMRKLQDKSGRPYDNAEGFEHVRQGRAGQWRQWFDRAELDAFDRAAGEVLRRLGYADDAAS